MLVLMLFVAAKPLNNLCWPWSIIKCKGCSSAILLSVGRSPRLCLTGRSDLQGAKRGSKRWLVGAERKKAVTARKRSW